MVQYSGLISIASAVGGLLVEHIVTLGGVQSLLYMALLATVLSWICDEIAYNMVHDHNAACTKVLLQRAEMKQSQIKKHNHQRNFWIAAGELIYHHDTLFLLFCEALIHQLCGNMLNITFHDGLRKSIPDSSVRAVVVGRFFATVNSIACILQIFALPYLLSHQSLPTFLKIIPLLVMVTIILSRYDYTEYFLRDTIAFGAVKILEYSIMTSATEMIYMPLDCEVRYIGKEFIRFFGHRLGKSAASIILCTLNAKYQWSHFSQSLLGFAFAALWEITMFILAQHIVATTDKSMANTPAPTPLPTPQGNSVPTSDDTTGSTIKHSFFVNPLKSLQNTPFTTPKAVMNFTFQFPWSARNSPIDNPTEDADSIDRRSFFQKGYLSHPVTPMSKAMFNPQTLSTSRSSSFLPDIFQWSSINGSISTTSLSNLLTSNSSRSIIQDQTNSDASNDTGFSSDSTESFESNPSDSESPNRQKKKRLTLRMYHDKPSYQVEDIGLSLNSNDDEEDWSSRPLSQPYPLNKVISLKDLPRMSDVDQIDIDRSDSNATTASAVTNDDYDNSDPRNSYEQYPMDKSSSQTSDHATNSKEPLMGGLRRRRQGNMNSSQDLTMVEGNMDTNLFDDITLPRRRQ